MKTRFVIPAVLICAAIARSQEPPKKSPPEPLPAEAIIADLREAYAQPTAEEVQVRFRAAPNSGLPERTDRFVIRIEPGDGPVHPRRVLLELGSLKIYLSAGKLTAINSGAPDKMYQRDYTEPLTPARLAELLPPLPVPQLDLACGADPQFKSPIIGLSDITWRGGIPDEAARPPIITMQGSGPAGTIELTSAVKSGRILKATATVRRRTSEGSWELTCRALEPGNPADWAIKSDGRLAVASLSDLRPTVKPMAPLQPGQPVPPLTFSRFDLTNLTLAEAMDSAKHQPAAILLIRHSAIPERAESALRDARTGLAVLRSLHLNQPPPGDPPDPARPPNPRFVAISSLVMELGDFSRDKWEKLRAAWGLIARGRQTSPESTFAGDDLLWTPGAGQTIDRFAPDAGAVIIIVHADRTLAAVVNLDGRANQAGPIAVEVLNALKASAGQN